MQKVIIKVKKNRSQVVYKEFENCEKLNYSIKGKKGTFYKKFEFILDTIKKELVQKNI